MKKTLFTLLFLALFNISFSLTLSYSQNEYIKDISYGLDLEEEDVYIMLSFLYVTDLLKMDAKHILSVIDINEVSKNENKYLKELGKELSLKVDSEKLDIDQQMISVLQMGKLYYDSYVEQNSLREKFLTFKAGDYIAYLPKNKADQIMIINMYNAYDILDVFETECLSIDEGCDDSYQDNKEYYDEYYGNDPEDNVDYSDEYEADRAYYEEVHQENEVKKYNFRVVSSLYMGFATYMRENLNWKKRVVLEEEE